MAVQVYRKPEDIESVALGYCYPIVHKQPTIERKARKQAKKGEKTAIILNEEVRRWTEELKITVVGNKQTQSFVELIQRYVKKVELVDTYEKGENYTFQQIEAADYAFILTDSVPHSVMDFLKASNFSEEKIQLFYLPNKAAGVVRLNSLYWNR